MSENKEILEKEVEAEDTVENEQEDVVEVEAEVEKDVEAEAAEEYDSELELISAVEKLIESFDVYTASVDERVGAIEKRMDEFFASIQEQEEAENVQDEDVQEPKEEKGLEGEDKFDAILKRLDEVAKSLVSAPEDRMGVNSGDEPAKEDKKLDRVSYKDIASYIAGKKPE